MNGSGASLRQCEKQIIVQEEVVQHVQLVSFAEEVAQLVDLDVRFSD
jgi:hypothetical protein